MSVLFDFGSWLYYSFQAWGNNHYKYWTFIELTIIIIKKQIFFVPYLTDAGYPIWWGQAPKIMYTFVENCNLSGKTVIPFCTSASSGIGTSATSGSRYQSGNVVKRKKVFGKFAKDRSGELDFRTWIIVRAVLQ